MTVLVTGATGFVGSHVAARLAASGRSVRLLVRDPAKPARVPALREVAVELVQGDVTDPASVTAAVEGCSGVVHAAARVSLATREIARVHAVNVGGTRTVLGAAAARGIPAVLVSSITVFTPRVAVLAPTTPLTPAGGAYTRSKVGAERVARALQDAGAPVAIVYPSSVLGPESPDMSVSHRALVSWLRTPPRTTSGTSIVDVRDVALGVGRALEQPGRWMLGGAFLTWSEMHDVLSDVTGVRRRAVPMPPRLLRAAGRLGDLAKRVVDFEYPLTYEAMSLATAGSPCNSTDACAALGLAWRPVSETLRDSIAWLARTGDLSSALAGRLAA